MNTASPSSPDPRHGRYVLDAVEFIKRCVCGCGETRRLHIGPKERAYVRQKRRADRAARARRRSR